MGLTRRAFVRALGAGSAGLVAGQVALLGARGREAWQAGDAPLPQAGPGGPVRLDSNENPNGPGTAVLEAIGGSLGLANRYPFRSQRPLVEAVARVAGVEPDQVLLGCGSTELLHLAVLAFTSAERALVAGAPTFENPVRTASRLGRRVIEVPVDGRQRLDLDRMGERAGGAGLVFLCNPNNPTGTVHGQAAVGDFVRRVLQGSPETVVLVDEAYHEYVDDPTYATAIPLAMAHPQVVVTRTFSKVFGMAGLRVGYAVGQRATLERMGAWAFGQNVSTPGQRAALAAIADPAHLERERRLNREARDFTRRAFEAMGFAPGDPQTNFVFVDIGRDAEAFRKACLAQGIAVGRLFPPFTTHTRVTIGTMDEMRRAAEVFKTILGKPA